MATNSTHKALIGPPSESLREKFVLFRRKARSKNNRVISYYFYKVCSLDLCKGPLGPLYTSLFGGDRENLEKKIKKTFNQLILQGFFVILSLYFFCKFASKAYNLYQK